jgi:hypothetical protein
MPLEFKDKGASKTQIAVTTRDLVIGHIRKVHFTERPASYKHNEWEWRLNLDHNTIPATMVTSKVTKSYEGAKQALEHNWHCGWRLLGYKRRRDVLADL